jgi:hypothetical protein
VGWTESSAHIYKERIMNLVEYKDIYGLYWRVKEIRRGYKLMLNRDTGKVELHDTLFGGKCMTFDLPINAAIIDKINETKIENFAKFLKQIEEENAKNQQKLINCAIDNVYNMYF